jgi:periplasmic protein TonB
MYANGFFEQQRRSPASLAVTIALHGAGIAALVLFGTTQITPQTETRTTVFNVPMPAPPPPPPPPPTPQPRVERQQPQERTYIDVPRTDIPPVVDAPRVQTGPADPPRGDPPGPRNVVIAEASPRLPPPVRRAAEVDPRYADAMQPPYPASEERAERVGSVRVRITIDTNGRVAAIEQISATSAAFWRVTEQQARNRWRFRPATVDGRPVQSTMVFTVTFRLPDA